MREHDTKTRNRTRAAAIVLLLAAIYFVILGFAKVVSPVTAIGNVAGVLTGGLVADSLALRT